MSLERFLIPDKVAVVTGAGRGIGRACAITLATAGADITLIARSETDLDEVRQEIERVGRRALIVAGDAADSSTLQRAVDSTIAQFGRLDIVVNNVGGTLPNTLLATSDEFFEQALHFNVTTALALTRMAVPHMLAGDGGAVINISSSLSRTAARGFTAYSTAKSALTHLSKQMAQDLAPRIRVNVVEAGSTRTSALEFVLTDEQVVSTMLKATPMRRLGDPDDIALAVLYLASPAASFVTGAVLAVDGGVTGSNLDLGLPDL